MGTTAPTPMLPDDHIDLLVSAAVEWRLITSRTAAAFAPALQEPHGLAGAPTQIGRLLRDANTAAVEELSRQGRTRLVDRSGQGHVYTFAPIAAPEPGEVIKAAHAAEASCAPGPGWAASAARHLLGMLSTAATHRLPGYADAPWIWTRPDRRHGRPVGVTPSTHPETRTQLGCA